MVLAVAVPPIHSSALPVSTVRVVRSQSRSLMAAAILAVSDPDLAARLDAWRDALSASIPEVPRDE